MAKFLNRFRLPIIAGDPSSPEDGEMWYNSTLNTFRMKPNSSFPMPTGPGTRFADYATATWYMVQNGSANTANANVSRAFTNPFVLPRKATLSGIAYEISTAWGTAAGNTRLGIYNDDGGRQPTALVADYGTVAATVGIKAVTVSTVLNPGMYWIVAVNQGGSGSPTGQFRSVSGEHEFIGDVGSTPGSSFFNGSLNSYYSDTGFTGALPSTFGAVAGITLGPRFAVRFSA